MNVEDRAFKDAIARQEIGHGPDGIYFKNPHLEARWQAIQLKSSAMEGAALIGIAGAAAAVYGAGAVAASATLMRLQFTAGVLRGMANSRMLGATIRAQQFVQQSFQRTNIALQSTAYRMTPFIKRTVEGARSGLEKGKGRDAAVGAIAGAVGGRWGGWIALGYAGYKVVDKIVKEIRSGNNKETGSGNSIDSSSFKEGVQQNGLSESYNGGNPEAPIPDGGGGGGGEIGGVGNKVAIIEGLFDKYCSVEGTEHLFYIPAFEGKQPFANEELQQLLRELAIGIYAHDTVPFFSLHFNGNSDLYPVIHPAYQNTLVGRVIGMLDYYMKGFLNGGYFPEEFVHEWQSTRTHDPAILKARLEDVHALCQQHLDQPYYSIPELLDLLKRKDKYKAEKATEKLETLPEEPLVLSDYSGFRSSFRIIAKQNSIKQSENLFILDGGFDVFYSIEPDPVYEEELRKYRNQYGRDPAGYTRLVKAYEAMKGQIEEMMPRLPPFRELFDMLNVINFFSYYFKTLKRAHKVPIFDTKVTNTGFSCPPLFPHLPVRKIAFQEIPFNWDDFFGGLPDECKQQINHFLKNLAKESEPPQEMIDKLTQHFAIYLQAKLSFPLSQDSQVILGRKAKIRQILKDLIETTQEFVVAREKKLLDLQTSEPALTKLIDDMRATLDRRKQEQQAVKENLPKLEAQLVVLQQTLKDIEQYQDQLPTEVAQEHAQAVAGIQQHYAQQRTAITQQHAQEVARSGQHYTQQRTLANQQHAQAVAQIGQAYTQARTSAQQQHAQAVARLRQQAANLGANVNQVAVNNELTRLNNLLNARTVELNQAEAADLAQCNNELNAGLAPLNQAEAAGLVQVNNLLNAVTVQLNQDEAADLAQCNTSRDEILVKKKALCVTGITECKSEIASIQEGIQECKDAQPKIEESLKELPNAIQLAEKDLQNRLENMRQIELLYNDLLSISKNYKTSWPEANQVLRLFTELSTDEQNEYKRVVGGCGLKLDTLNVTFDPSGQEILNQSCPDLLEAEDEELKPVCVGSEKKAGGYIFRLHYADYHTSKSEEYEWMQYLLPRAEPKHPLQKAKAFAAVYRENAEAFASAIKQPEVNAYDRDCRGIALAHYAASSVADRYLAELISRGASLKIEDPMGYIPLHYAAKGGSLENVKLFLEHHPETINQHNKNDETALYLAVQHNQLSVVKFLIKKGANFNTQTSHGMSPLYCAIHHGFDEIALELLNCEGINVNLSLEDGTTPLYLAAASDNHRLVTRLLEKGANTNLCRIDSYAPLHIVAKKGKAAMLRLLLQHPALNINLPLKSGKTALHLAAECNHHEITRILLENGADASPFGWDRETALLTAIRSGNPVAAEYIIHFANQIQIQHEGINFRLIDFPDIRNQTPLQAVLERRCFSVLESLLKHGVLLPPIPEFVNQLCKAKVDPLLIRNYCEGLQENQRAEAFYLSAKHGHNQMVSLFQLLDHVADFRDEQGWTAKHFAAKYDHLNVLKDYLATSPTDLLQTDKAGKTMAAIAAEHGSPRFLKLILEAMHKKNISLEKHYQGNHLLLAAIEAGNQECAELIIEKMLDSNINIPIDQKGRHAAHIAAKNGDVEMLDFLRLRGARFEVYDREGKTPFHYAFANGWNDAIDYLLDKKHEFILPRDLLHFVAGIGTVKQLHKLFKRDDQVNRVFGPAKETPIFSAIRENNLACFDILCQRGADLGHISSEGLNPLQFAAKEGKEKLVKLMVTQGPALGKQVIPVQIKPNKGVIHEKIRKKEKVDFSAVDLSLKNEEGVSVLHFCAAKLKLKELSIAIRACDIDIEDKNGQTPLYYAIIAGRSDNVEFLLKSGANVNHMSHRRNAPLQVAVQSELPFVAQLLLRHGAKVDQLCGPCKRTCLHDAVQHEFFEIAKLLIANDADVNKADLFGICPIHIAAEKGNYGLLRLLKASGASLHLLDYEGQSVAHYAALSKNLMLIDLLKEEGISLDRPSRISIKSQRPSYVQKQGITPLHLTAKKGNVLMLKKLVSHGCRVEALDESGFSALCYASLSGNKEALQVFSDYRLMKNSDQRARAIVNAIREDLAHQLAAFYQGEPDQYLSPDGTTGLQVASIYGAARCTRYLLGQGANPNRTNVNGESAFELALKNRELMQARYLVLEMEKFDIQKQIEGKTYLHLACENGDLEMASLLIQWGASLDETDSHGLTALHYAAKQAHYQLLRLLLICGSDISKTMPDGTSTINLLEGKGIHVKRLIDKWQKVRMKAEEYHESPLHIAVRMNDHANIPLLLHIVDPEYPNKGGLSALHLAAGKGSQTICRMLLDYGVDIESQDVLGRTALFLAAVKGNSPKLVQLLLRCKANPQLEDKNHETVLFAVAQRPYEEHCIQIFNLLYSALPKQKIEQPTATMVSAFKNKNSKTLFRALQQGHPLKTASFSLLHMAVIHDWTPALIALLVWFQMDPNAKDLTGRPAVEIAIRSKRTDLAAILIDHGAQIDPHVKKQIDLLGRLRQSIDQKINAFDEGWRSKLSELAAQKGLKVSIPPSRQAAAVLPISNAKQSKIQSEPSVTLEIPAQKTSKSVKKDSYIRLQENVVKLHPLVTETPSSSPNWVAQKDFPKTVNVNRIYPQNFLRNRVENGPIGFTNIGNSCYLNATLQMLFNIPEIRTVIAQRKNDQNNPIIQSLFSLMNIGNASESQTILSNLRIQLFQSAGRGELTGGIFGQQDAHEILLLILNQLKWTPMKIRSCYTCGEIVHVPPEDTQNTHHLSIELEESEHEARFQMILDSYFQEERIRDFLTFEVAGHTRRSNQWRKTFQVTQFPSHLIIQLKRFNQEGQKIATPVAFPENKIVQFVSIGGNIEQYEIVAHVNHTGANMDAGHYVADVKNFRDPDGRQRWIHCNDDNVREVICQNSSQDIYLVLLKHIGR